jgi:putative ABC transport system permease protein
MVVVLTLAVAIAATAVIYSAIDTVWHFIPIAKRDGLVHAAATDARVVQTDAGGRSVEFRSPTSVPDLADWSARSTSFDELAGFEMGAANLTGIDVPIRVSTIRVTANLPALWGFTPTLGRLFRPEEGHAGATGATLLTHGFWQRQFSSNAGVLGQSLLLDGVPHTVIGVLPPLAGTGLFKDADVFVPLVLDPLRTRRDERNVFVTGRLKPGVTRAQATADLDAIARRLQVEHPDTNQRIGASVLPLIEASGMNVRLLLSLLGAIALLVLVVACANVANVTVAQSLGRRHELAIRAALGASRADRIRQLMTESTLLSLTAAGVGLLLAAWGVDALRWLGGDSFGFAEIRISGRVLVAGLVTALVAPLGFGLLPALGAAAADPQELKDGARHLGASSRSHRTRSVIIGLQAGAAMVLMVQIGLLVRTTWELSEIRPGFDPVQVLTFHVGLSGSRYTEPGAADRFTNQVMSRVRALPGVASVGIVDRLPIADSEPMVRLTVEGEAPEPLETRPLVARAAIAGDYFATMRIPIMRGRPFSETETANASPVALVNEEAARRFWPGRDPLGARIALDVQGSDPVTRSDARGPTPAWLTVVGVVGNTRNSDIDQGSLPQVYVSTTRQPSGVVGVVVKTSVADPLQLVPAIRTQVAGIDRDQPVHDVATMSQVLFDDLGSTYVLAAMLTVIGLVALLLSAAGIYGVVSHAVAQRRREIGVRLALGARPGAIVRMVVGHGTKPVIVGSFIGLLAAVALAFWSATALSAIEARDPLNYIVVAMTIAAVALAASYLPARRAAAIDPVAALRE